MIHRMLQRMAGSVQLQADMRLEHLQQTTYTHNQYQKLVILVMDELQQITNLISNTKIYVMVAKNLPSRS